MTDRRLLVLNIGADRQMVASELMRSEPQTCIICGQPTRRQQALDMHEGIIKRGDTPNLDWQYNHFNLIFNIYNCVIVHHECHMREGQLPKLRDKIVRYKTNRYGSSVQNWLRQAAEAGLLKAEELIRLYFEETTQTGGL